MLLLKSTYRINNILRFLITLPGRVVRSNNYTRIGLLFILFALTNKGFAQTGTGTCTDPFIIDLTGHPDTNFRRTGDARSAAQCCVVSGNSTTCVNYRIILDPGTDVLSISLPPNGKKSNSEGYYVNCDGPTGGYSLGTPVCVSDKSIPYVITYCKPGNDASVDLLFTTSSGFGVSSNISLRPGCTGTISVTGLISSTIQWNSIYPGNPQDYNSYLSPASGSAVVTVTPPAVPPANGYIDYQVTGIEQSPCNTVHKTGVVRVWTYPALNVSLTSSAGTVCSGNPVTLTATVSGGNPGYTYLWSNGATTPSITVNTAGTYTVSVNDQLANCGMTTKSINIAAATPVPPTAPPVTICNGNQALLNATGPGGPYQWYDNFGNPVGDGISASYLTTTLTAGTYDYSVMTSYGGCPSARTTVKVTVLATSPAPTAAPVTGCTGQPATLTAAGGGPYQWYDPNGNPVGDGISASYTVNGLAPGPYTYYVTSSSTGCPGPKTSVQLTVLPTPPGPTAPSVSTCSGQQAVLNATGGGPYQWYDQGGNPIPGATGASYQAPLLPPGTYTYYVTAVTNGCTSARTPVTVTVLATPPGPTAPPVTICSGQQANLQATFPGGPYQWYDQYGNPVGDGVSANYLTLPLTTTGSSNTIYPYTVKSSYGGCPSQPTTVPVTVTPLPPTPTVQPQ